jgi:hypothetical protein
MQINVYFLTQTALPPPPLSESAHCTNFITGWMGATDCGVSGDRKIFCLCRQSKSFFSVIYFVPSHYTD